MKQRKLLYIALPVGVLILILTWSVYAFTQSQAARKAETVAERVDQIQSNSTNDKAVLSLASTVMKAASSVVADDGLTQEQLFSEVAAGNFIAPTELTSTIHYATEVKGDKQRAFIAEYGLIALAESLESNGSGDFTFTPTTDIIFDSDTMSARLYFDEVAGRSIPFSLKFVYLDGKWMVDGEDLIEQVRINGIAREATAE